MALGTGRRLATGSRLLLLALAASLFVSVSALAQGLDFVEPSGSPEAVGDAPISVAPADLDGDTDTDLAVANEASGDVSILANDGHGDFSELGTSPEGAVLQPQFVVAANLDGDNDIDLAVDDGSSVSVLLNDGSGDFSEPVTSPEATGNGLSIAAGDLDGDDDTDLAVVNACQEEDPGDCNDDVSVLLNNGSGDFSEPATSPENVSGLYPRALTAADLDGDDDTDLAVVSEDSDTLSILENDGSGDFSEPATSPDIVGGGPVSIVAADFDGDIDIDVATANSASDNVTVMLNDGSGDFSEPGTSPEEAGVLARAIAAADLDGDGDVDLAVANRSSDTVSVLDNDGSGDFSEPATSPEAVGEWPQFVAAADLDGDDHADLAVANTLDDDVTILLQSVTPPPGPTCFGSGATITGDANDADGGATDGDVDGTPGADVILTGGDDDTVFAGDGSDRICTRTGDDTVRGEAGADQILSGNGNDDVGGQGGDDEAYAGLGRDVVKGGAGNDLVNGQNDDDIVRGQNHDDRVFGGSGNDRVTGDSGTDRCTGNAGTDSYLGCETVTDGPT